MTGTRLAARTAGWLMTFGLAACGGGERDAGGEPERERQAAPAATAPDPCTVVPRAAAEQILGSTVNQPSPTEREIGSGEDRGVMRMCEYVAGGPAGRRGVLLTVRAAPAYTADPRVYQSYADGMEENLGQRPEVMHLSGLGSAALWDATNHTLLVRGAGWEVHVQESMFRTETRLSLETARAFAERMVAGMR